MWFKQCDITVTLLCFSDDRKEWRERYFLFFFSQFDLKTRQRSFGRVKDVELEILMLPDEADARFPDCPEPQVSSLLQKSLVFLF